VTSFTRGGAPADVSSGRLEDPVQHSSAASGRSHIRTALAVLISLAAAPGLASAQEVYKSVDAQGHVVYSDRAPTKNAQKSTLHVEQGDPAEAARLAKEQAQLKAADLERSMQHAVEDKNKAVADHHRQVACQNARNRYFQLKESGRIFQRDAAGNRVYYSDSEADAMREQARKAMIAACGP
jgi:hypothetical protein